MKASITINFSNKEKDRFAAFVKQELLRQMNERIQRELPGLREYVEFWIKTYLEHSHTTIALTGNEDQIQYDIGLKKGEAAKTIDEIGQIVARTMQIGSKVSRESVNVYLYMVKEDYLDILGINEASFTSIGKSKEFIPWLDWFLRKGDKIIFDGYRVKYLTESSNRSLPARYSRSGYAIMAKGGSFRLPPELGPFSATNNFIVRALANLGPLLQVELDGILK